MKRFTITTTCVAIALLGNQTSAALIDLDFEAPTYTSGATADMQDGWLATNAPNNDPGASEIQTATVFSGTQALKTTANTGGAFGTGSSRLARAGISGIDPDGESVSWYANTADTSSTGFYYFGNAGSFGDAAVNVGLSGSNYFYRDGPTGGGDTHFAGNVTSSGAGLVADEWYNFTVVFDFTNSEYDLSIQSTSLGTTDPGYLDFSLDDIGFRNQSLTAVETIMILSSSANGLFTDDISFTAIPEPTAFILCTVGMFLAGGMRQRRR